MERTEFLERLKGIRYGWSDIIPGEVVDSTSGIRTKARSGWFAASAMYLGLGAKMGYLDQRLSDSFVDRTRELNGGRLTEMKDIEYGNRVLDYALAVVINSREQAKAA